MFKIELKLSKIQKCRVKYESVHYKFLNIYIIQILKNFENLSVEKRRFRLRWDSSPGYYS